MRVKNSPTDALSEAELEKAFELSKFSEVFSSEISEVNLKRKRVGNCKPASLQFVSSGHKDFAPKISEEASTKLQADTSDGNDSLVGDLAGLCISGGGIRSAAFSIGVTQAMDALKVKRAHKGAKEATAFEQMDYMSTVSGGGYTGSCLSAAMANPDDSFPFPSTLEKTESAVLRHIRSHSNYMFPRGGLFEKLSVLSVYIRGIFANAPAIIFVLLTAVLITIFSNNDLTQVYTPSIFSLELADIAKELGYETTNFNQGFFVVFLIFTGLLFLAIIAWAVARTIGRRPRYETKALGTKLIASLLILAFVIFAFELQPKMIAGIHGQYCEDIRENYIAKEEGKGLVGSPSREDLLKNASCDKVGLGTEITLRDISNDVSPEKEQKPFYQQLLGQFQTIATVLSGIAAVVAAVSGFLGIGEASASQAKSGVAAMVQKFARSVLYLALGLLLPLLLWLFYLYLSFWGMSGTPEKVFFCHAPSFLSWYGSPNCMSEIVGITPAVIYVLIWVLSFVVALNIGTNKNSPHGLYRDGLAKAFLVRENQTPTGNNGDINLVDELDMLPLSETSNGRAPLHIVNAALNIQASKRANGHGRNAGFFTFSKTHMGSFETGYLPSTTLELIESKGRGYEAGAFGIGSAMAVSAAAAATAMGSMTMKPFAITLAFLNVRMGYWFKNPSVLARMAKQAKARSLLDGTYRNAWESSSFSLLGREMFGDMDEENPFLYLTDGGHIENLGLYTLLQRRCRYIVVVDGEADPGMTFSSLITAQRYARIDLGTRIDIDVSKIKQASKIASNECRDIVAKGNAVEPIPIELRPHCAIGKIFYPKDKSGKVQEGVILYIKSSITGDENDYIKDYARRNPSFPHETTGDQFFSEEQFEAYRALGFHAAFGALNGSSIIQEGNNVVNLPGPGNKKKSAAVGSGSQKIWQELFNKVSYHY